MGNVYGIQPLSAVQLAFFPLFGRLFLGVNTATPSSAFLSLCLSLPGPQPRWGSCLDSSLRPKKRDRRRGAALRPTPAAPLGGFWWPLKIVPEWTQNAPLAVPTAWVMKALHQLIGSGLGGAAPTIGVLILFALAANTAAMRFPRTG